jgi:hypothetical protein
MAIFISEFPNHVLTVQDSVKKYQYGKLWNGMLFISSVVTNQGLSIFNIQINNRRHYDFFFET